MQGPYIQLRISEPAIGSCNKVLTPSLQLGRAFRVLDPGVEVSGASALREEWQGFVYWLGRAQWRPTGVDQLT